MGPENRSHTPDEEKMSLDDASDEATIMKNYAKNVAYPNKTTRKDYEQADGAIEGIKEVKRFKVQTWEGKEPIAYDPVPGSAEAEMKKVADMEKAEDDFAEMEHNQGREEIDWYEDEK